MSGNLTWWQTVGTGQAFGVREAVFWGLMVLGVVTILLGLYRIGLRMRMANPGKSCRQIMLEQFKFAREKQPPVSDVIHNQWKRNKWR